MLPRAPIVRGSIAAILAMVLGGPRVVAATNDVEAVVAHGALVIVGDAQANHLYIDQFALSDGSLRITPQDGTTLNSSSDAAIFSAITHGVTAKLGAGANQLVLGRVRVPGDVVVTGGSGGNAITLVGAFGDVMLKLGGGHDVVNVYGDELTATTLGDLTMLLGDGDNGVLLYGDLVLTGTVSVKAQNGPDGLGIDADIGGDLKLDLGAGDNFAYIQDHSAVAGDFSVKAKGGRDHVVLSQNAAIAGHGSFDLGGGEENTVSCFDHSRIEGPVRFTAKEGFNTFSVFGGTSVGDVSIGLSGRVGMVLLNEDSVINGSLRFRGRGGIDQFFLHQGARVAKDLTLTLGGGDDAAYLNSESVVGGAVKIALGGGDDEVGMTRTSVQGSARVSVGDGSNKVRCRDSAIAGDLTIKAGTGDDRIDTLGMAVAGTTTITAGGGTNAVVP